MWIGVENRGEEGLRGREQPGHPRRFPGFPQHVPPIHSDLHMQRREEYGARQGFPRFLLVFHRLYCYYGLYLVLEKRYSTALQLAARCERGIR